MESVARKDGRKGRGARSNASGRYEKEARDAFDDGWGSLDEEPPPLTTTVGIDRSRTVIARNQSPDVPFEQSINPYRGCEHGCTYCFARPTHAWLGLSPGLDFESRLFAKPDAPRLLKRELANPRYRCRTIAMGTNTDPYQPIERRYRITREILEVLTAHNHPVSIVTKSALVLRDLDILSPMAAKGLVKVCLSVTTLDRRLARRMEPRAATPAKRLEAIGKLNEAGVPVGVLVAPVIPALNDHEIEAILSATRKSGARTAGYVLLRLPLEIKELFREWLEACYPERAARVYNRIREMHEGALYRDRWGARQTGTGVNADLLAHRFERACRELGFGTQEEPLNHSLFRRTSDGSQLSFL